MSVSPTSAILSVNQTIDLIATLLPAGANEPLEWLSSNGTVATVDAGEVTAKAIGTTTITVRTIDRRLSAICNITVVSNSIPTDGLTLHLVSDQQFKNVISETVWSDLSVKGNHFSQKTGIKMPQQSPNALNNLPSIKFDGGDALIGPVNGLQSSTGLLTFDVVKDKPFTLILVGRAKDSVNNSTFFSKSGGWGTQATYSFGRNSSDSFQQVIKGKNDAKISVANDYFNVHITEWSGLSATQLHQYYLNGIVKNNHSAIGSATNQNTSYVAIGGANSGTDYYLNGDIMEVIVYNRVLTTAEIESVNKYLNDRYFSINWNFDDKQDFNGGNPSMNNVTGFKIQDGLMSGTVNGNDPYLVSKDPLNVEIGNSNKLKIRLKNQTSSNTAQIYFTTGTSMNFDEAKHVDFPIQPNSDFVEYTIDMSENSQWVGQIKALRIDPATNTNKGSFAIDFIKLCY